MKKPGNNFGRARHQSVGLWLGPAVAILMFFAGPPATLAASCAFMLPVATLPNANVFVSGMITIPKMVRAAFALHFVGIILVSPVALTLAPKFL